MLVEVFSVYDDKQAAYRSPFFAQTVGIGQRMFSDGVNDRNEGNVIRSHPEDFSLFHLGTYDDQTGRFENLVSPRQLNLATEVLSVNK